MHIRYDAKGLALTAAILNSAISRVIAESRSSSVAVKSHPLQANAVRRLLPYEHVTGVRAPEPDPSLRLSKWKEDPEMDRETIVVWSLSEINPVTFEIVNLAACNDPIYGAEPLQLAT